MTANTALNSERLTYMERLKIVSEAAHSARLEGREVSEEAKADGLAWARGEISAEEVLNRVRERHGL